MTNFYMPISASNLHSIAQLAYLETNAHDMDILATEVSSIIDYVQQLQQIDTSDVAPLFHPLNLQQRLRSDEASEANCLAQLAELAPHFDQDVYLVPTVIEADKS